MPPSSQAPSPDSDAGYLLSLATMEWLIDERRLTPTAAAPFGFLVRTARHTTTDARAAAAQRELGDAPDPGLMQALDIASQPEARIRLSMLSPNRPPQQITLLRRGDSLAQCGFNADGFLFGEPLPIEDLVALLTGQLSSQAPSASTTDHLMSPRALGVLTALWPGNRLASTAALPRDVALATCQRLGAEDAGAQPLMDDLVACGHVRETDAAFLLDDEWRPWLERLWSGEHFELEATPLPAAELDAAHLAERRERLLFVGPKGQRIACRVVDGERFHDVVLGEPHQEGQAEPLLALSFLDGEFLTDVLRAFLRIDESGFLRAWRQTATAASAPRPEHAPGA